MSQTQPLWTIYQNVHNNYRSKYNSLPKPIKILVSIFVHELSHEEEPELFPDVFSCNEEGSYGFRIGNRRILFKLEILSQGFTDERILHMIDIV